MSFTSFTPLGFYIGFEVEDNTLIIRTQNGSIQLCVVNQNTINVKVLRHTDEIRDFSYAVQGYEKWPIEVQEGQNSLYFNTEFMRVQILQRPLMITFANNYGHRFLSDDQTYVAGWIGDEVTAYKMLMPHDHFFGLGTKTGPLDKVNTQWVNWNKDAQAYGAETDPLHTSIPFFTGISGQAAYGLFLDNTTKTSFDFGATDNRFVSLKAESGILNYYVFSAPDMAGVLSAYTQLTGRMEMPPLWSLGYQQYPHKNDGDKDILRIAHTFRDKGIPCDVLYLDMDYMQDNKVFTWKDGVPEIISKLKEMGFRVVLTVHPAVKIEQGYDIYQSGLEMGVFLRYPEIKYTRQPGETFRGEGAPGWSHFPDFTSTMSRQWWSEQFNTLVSFGVEGFWCERSEPAVKGGELPDMLEVSYDGQNTTYKHGHNVYGMQMARATFEGVKDRENAKRPYVLTRNGYAGIQRYAALLAGNTVSTGEQLLQGARMVSGMGMSGLAFAGLDMGGMDGNMTAELYARWMQLGAFMPFFRGHAAVNDCDAEPWSFGREAEEISRAQIKLRYRLLPYTYSLFYEAAQTGVPLVRSLAFYHAEDRDTKIYDNTYQNQFYYGPSTLVCPVVPGEEYARVYLPYGTFYDAYNDEKISSTGKEIVTPLTRDRLPIYIKSGAIITRHQPMAHTGESIPVLEIHLYKGSEETTFTHYEDDGETYDYKEGKYYSRGMRFDTKLGQFTIEKKKGNFASRYTLLQVYFHGYAAHEIKPAVNGDRVDVQTLDAHFVDPVTNYTPAHKVRQPDKVISQLPFIELDNIDKAILVTF